MNLIDNPYLYIGKILPPEKHKKYRPHGACKKKRDKEHEKILKRISKMSKRRNRK